MFRIRLKITDKCVHGPANLKALTTIAMLLILFLTSAVTGARDH